ncbi:MAG TPA: hypothetical protein VGC26_03875 [Afipia sp.]
MAETFTRQQLHDLIWSAPMREVAKRLGLSDVGLRKHCVKSFVPPPPQGHWNKVHAGQAVKIVPLPPRPPGIPDEISIGQDDYRTDNQRLLAKEPVPPVFDETIENLRTRLARNIGIVVASKNLNTPHIAFRREFEEDARRKLARSTWDPPVLASAFEQRRLRILQGLFYGLARVDCVASTQGKDVRTISISVGRQQVWITLDRLSAARQRARTADLAGDLLKLAIIDGFQATKERVSWQDNEGSGIEAQLGEIATEIVVTGELQYREHMQWRYETTLKHREELRQQAIRRKLEEEKAERDRLLKLEAERLRRLVEGAADHRKANDIRNFVTSVMTEAAAKGNDERVQRWKEWALAQADKIDPVATGRIWDQVNDAE